ncbi:MAG: hypothetical protein KGM43_02410 [Planctomycetota bacterium]|nr:hypothetical protein [Planctomycetota bacterium]
MDADAHDNDLPEIGIEVDPKAGILSKLGIDEAEFEAAVMAAYDALDVADPDAVPPIEDVEVEIRGRKHRLGDIADIEITGDVVELDELLDRLEGHDEHDHDHNGA